MMFIRNICHGYTVLLGISLALSAFTHLWNPLGFPSVYVDEGHYMRRAMQVLKGLGPQEHHYPYDHPYFGQLFLAGVFKVIGYPNSLLSPSSSSLSSSSSSSSSVNVLHSIEMLYLIPRVLMGILAVVDTFLIYKISERRYNRNVAIIASILFAVMPLSWLMRRILLDTILMPFLLSSILFALYIRGYSKNGDHSSSWWSKRKNNNITLTLLSGIFLGLAIFTKIPAFTMIPLVGYIIFYEINKKNVQQTITKYFSNNNNKRFRINNYYLRDII